MSHVGSGFLVLRNMGTEKLKLGSRHRPQAGAEPAFVQEPRLRLGDLLRGWAAAGLLGPGGRGARASG